MDEQDRKDKGGGSDITAPQRDHVAVRFLQLSPGNEQERHARREASRDPTPTSLMQGGDEQADDRCDSHDPCRKAPEHRTQRRGSRAEQPHWHRAEPGDERRSGAGKKEDDYRAQSLLRRVARLNRMSDAFGGAGILA